MKNSPLFEAMLQENESVFVGMEQSVFYTTMLAGDLSSGMRQAFIDQDQLYLRKYAEAIRIVTQRLCSTAYHVRYEAEIQHLEQFAIRLDAYVVFLQENYPRPLVDGSLFQSRTPVSSVIANYSRHLLITTKHGSIEAAVACLTPCLFIYHRRLGEKLKASGCAIDNPDRLLLESFFDPQFVFDAIALENLLNKCAGKTDPKSSEGVAARKAFTVSSQFELAFFDDQVKYMPDVVATSHVAILV